MCPCFQVATESAGHARVGGERGGRLCHLETQCALMHELALAERERAADHGRADNVELVLAEHGGERFGAKVC